MAADLYETSAQPTDVRLPEKPFLENVMNMYTINNPLRTPFPPSSSLGLCQLCKTLGDWSVANWISTVQTRIKYKHHLSWNAFSESASTGCSFCYQLALEGEQGVIGGTIAFKIQHGRPTAFTTEMDGASPKIVVRCDRLEWGVLDVYTVASRSVGLLMLVVGIDLLSYR